MAGQAARQQRVRALPGTALRIPVCLAAARQHAEASLPHVTTDDYMVTHWLAAYAVLLLGEAATVPR